jgi:flagellar biosynthetic protein FlhF
MFVKRFLANDMQEAIRKINNEFGPDAVILENKSVRSKGVTGLFKKKMVEVVAAYEPDHPKKQAPRKPAPAKAEPDAPAPKSESAPDSAQTSMLGKQVQELKDVVQDFTNKIRIANRETTLTYSSEVLSLYNGLVERDVQEEICKEIAVQTQTIQSRREVDAKTVAQQLVFDRLGEPMPLKLRKFEQNVLLFAGPTGAGKTTTLAKLAGRLKFKEHLEVGLINTDTYRVGAMEHIRIYSEIMDIPLINAYNPGELKEALQSLADKDVVLIDTAGKSAKDEGYQKELEQLIEAARADEVFLVLSVVTGCKACREVIDHYSFINSYKLIITKLDEVGVWGNVLNIADFSKKGLSYVTMGQNVPDDIREVNTLKLAGNIVGDGEACYD